MTNKHAQPSHPTIAAEAMHQFAVRHEALEADLGFTLASLDVPTNDPEAMREVFASLIAMGAARLLALGVSVDDLMALSDEVIEATAQGPA